MKEALGTLEQSHSAIRRNTDAVFAFKRKYNTYRNSYKSVIARVHLF